MNRRLLLCITCLFIFGKIGFAEVKVSRNVNVVANEPIPQKQLEVDAQASPANPNLLFTGYINYQTGTEAADERITARARCGFSYSTNGGKTWKVSAVNAENGLLPTAVPEATVLKCGDPAVTIDGSGNIYYFFLTELTDGQTTMMSVARFSDPNDGSGKIIYQGQVQIDSGGARGQVLDKGSIMWMPDPFSPDPTAPGTLYACYANFDGSQYRKVVCSVSSNRGLSFSKPNQTKLNGTVGSANGVALAPGPNGSAYLVFYASASNERNYYFLKVTPDGNSAGAPIPILTTAFYPYEAPTRRDLARFPAFATIVSDGSQWISVLFSGYSNGFNVAAPGPGTSPHIFATTSSNAGLTWTPPVVIDPGPAGRETVTHQFGARATYVAGLVSVLYYDGRNDNCWDQEPANPGLCGRPLNQVTEGYFPTGRDRRFDPRVIQGTVSNGAVIFSGPSTQVSRYDVNAKTHKIQQRNVNPECSFLKDTVCTGVNLFNLPVSNFGGCTTGANPVCGSSFGGDYIAHAAKAQWLRNPTGVSPAYRYTRPGDSTTTLALWTDFRRVALPLKNGIPDINGDWTNFVNAGVTNCVNPQIKNTDVEYAEITVSGLSASIKGAALRLGIPPDFSVTVWNRTGRLDANGDPIPLFVRLTIEDTASENWSFVQTPPSPAAIPADRNSVDVKILNSSSVTLSVFYGYRFPGVNATPATPVRIRVEEIDTIPNGSLVNGGLTTSATYNPSPFTLPDDHAPAHGLTLLGPPSVTTFSSVSSSTSHSGFDDLGFDDLGFDDLGFDDLGFDDLGFDDLGFSSIPDSDTALIPNKQVTYAVTGGGSFSTVGRTFSNISNGQELLNNDWKFWVGIVQTQWNTNVSECTLIRTPTDIVLSSIPITQGGAQNFQVAFDDLGFDDLGFDDLGFSTVSEQFYDASFSLHKEELAKIVVRAFSPENSTLSFDTSDDKLGEAAFGPADPITGAPTGAFFDTTPPIITPSVTGTLGKNGWFTSDVTVKWIVKDAQSGVSSQSTSCTQTTIINYETAGVDLTCSAYNNLPDTEQLDRRFSSKTITIKVDKTPPIITASINPSSPASTGWYNIATGRPTVSFTCNYAISGVGTSCPAAVQVPDGANQSVTSGIIEDAAGNKGGPAVITGINVDMVAPNTTISAGPANGASIYTSTVTFSFSASDPAPGSGIASLECKMDNGVFSACVSPFTRSGLAFGAHTFSVRATDTAGNIDLTPDSRTFYVSYQFVGFFTPLGAPDTYWGASPLGTAQPFKYQLLFEGTAVSNLASLQAVEAYFTGPAQNNSCPVTIVGSPILVYAPATGFKGASDLKFGNSQFTFSMDTKIFAPTPGKGCYTMVLRLLDGQLKKGSLQLK